MTKEKGLSSSGYNLRDDHFCQIYSTSLASAAAANFFLQSRTNVACLCILPSNIKSWNPILRCDTERKDWDDEVIVSSSQFPPFQSHSLSSLLQTHTLSLSASFLFSVHTLSSLLLSFNRRRSRRRNNIIYTVWRYRSACSCLAIRPSRHIIRSRNLLAILAARHLSRAFFEKVTMPSTM